MVEGSLERQQLDSHHAASPAGDIPVTIIRPASGWRWLDLREAWESRELLFFLVWRDIKVRYKQTVLGGTWAIIQPLFTMIVFSIFFGRLAGISSNGIPYPVFAYSALVPWTYFANALSGASNSLVAQERLISKVYFPRLLVPAASVLGGLVDFAIAFTVLIGLQLYYGITPGPAVVLLPFFILLAATVALGVGLWLSALNVQYRDVRYTVPFLIQFWLFATPVAYPSSLVPEQWRPLYGLNPMAGVVEGFRWALLGQEQISMPMLGVSVAIAVVLLLTGLVYFRRVESTFVDVV